MNVNDFLLLTPVRRALWAALLIATFATAFALSSVFDAPDAHASKLGRVFFSGNPATNEGQTCTACHSGPDGATLALSGPSEVTSGETYRYSATISGGPAAVGGLNVSMTDGLGSLDPVDELLQKIDVELSHSEPQPFADGSLTFDFEWTAPDFGTDVTMYAAGLSANNNVLLTGDSVGQNALDITVSGPQATATPAPTTAPADSVRFAALTSGFDSPTDLQHAGDTRLFVTEQRGTIAIIENGSVRSQPFLDISGRVSDASNEMGLLGLAFHPDYARNGYFYVNYTADSPRRTVVSRFSVGGDANRADANSELILLEIDQPASNHNAGQIQFGPDGYLYISSGDGGGGGDPFETGQNDEQLLGKILRIDVDQSTGGAPDCGGEGVVGQRYTVPADNPFVDGAGGKCDEIWATGLRNPWRFSFDALTGDMWIGDVGQGAREEIDFQPVTSSGGENYGWDCYEGNQQFESTGCLDRSAYVFPAYDYDRSGGSCSVTGGIVYRGERFPSLVGQYIFADFCRADLWSLRPGASGLDFTEFRITGGDSLSSPVAFGEDAAGELYVVSRGGAIYRIETDDVAPTVTPVPPTVTPVPPTETPLPPSATPIPPTNTPTNTPLPPATSTNTPELVPTSTSTATATSPAATATSTAAATVTATATATATPASSPQSVAGLVLVNADTGADVGPLADGDVVDLAALGTRNLSVRAETEPRTVGSVRFGLNEIERFHVENYVPYTLRGDYNRGRGYFAWTPQPGDYTLTVTPFSERLTGGTAGTPLTVRFTVVEGAQPTPAPTATLAPDADPLAYRTFAGTWRQLPDFAALTPQQTGRTDAFDIGIAGRSEKFAVHFRTCLQIDAAGEYAFSTRSDDGSQLFVNGELVVDNDGLHAARTRSGRVALDAGSHVLDLTFFERFGKEVLDVRYSGPGVDEQPLPASVLNASGCDIDAALPQVAALADRVSLFGQLFADSNRNGLLDEGEVTLPNVTLTLRPAPDAGTATEVDAAFDSDNLTTISDDDGLYSYANIPAGTYEIDLALPAGYRIGDSATLIITLESGSLEMPAFDIVPEQATPLDQQLFIPLVQQ